LVYSLYQLRFEFDPAKSAANKAKHGIDFEEAQGLWLDAHRLERSARSLDESRVSVIGRIGTTIWHAVITYRHDTIRIISTRCARPEERAAYHADPHRR